MRIEPRLLVLAAVCLTGCSTPGLVSTLPVAAAAAALPSLVGMRIAALPRGAVGAAVAAQKAEFERRLKGVTTHELRLLPEDMLGLRLEAAASFESGSAQLRPAALVGYAEIADVLKAHPSSVAHVLVHGDYGAAAGPVAQGDIALSLPARRAAALSDYLSRRGLPWTRLRSEGRVSIGAAQQVELVLKPVVQGSEARAWTPPP